MSDLARLLQQYGYGQEAPMQGETLSTSNVLAGMPKRSPLADALQVAGVPKDEHGFLFSNVGGELKFNPYEAIKSFMGYRAPPGALSTSGDDAPVRNSAEAAGWLGLSGLGLNFAGQVPKNALGIFGGRLAKTADHAALAKAEELAAKGADRREIWDQTGWFQGADGKWRFEIDDSKMGFAVKPTDWIAKPEPGKPYMAPNVEVAANKAMESLAPGAPLRMKRLFEHEALQNAYPQGFSGSSDWHHQGIMSMPVKLLEGEGPAAVYAGDFIGLHQSLPPGTAKGAALHEMQHAVQNKEGFAPGDRADRYQISDLKAEAIKPYDDQISALMRDYPEAAEVYRARNRMQAALRGKEWSDADHAAMDALEERLFAVPGGKNLDRLDFERQSLWHNPDDYWKDMARDLYMRSAGEVEARNVEKRMNMSPDERRATPPWETEPVPPSRQRVR